MKLSTIAFAALAILPASALLAGDDCHAPRDLWQTSEAATQAAVDLGWQVVEIEIDDGCWEIKGLDALGHRIKAKLDPATLEVIELRHRDSRRTDGHDRERTPQADPPARSVNPLFQNGTAPIVRVN